MADSPLGYHNSEGDWVPADPPEAPRTPEVHAMLRAIADGVIDKAFHTDQRWVRNDGMELSRDHRRALERILKAHWISWFPRNRGPMTLDLMPEAYQVLHLWDQGD
jgi:hypothetical protein